MVSSQCLAFEHNDHQIDDGIMMAQRLEFDQFILSSPFDVSRDDPGIRLSTRAPRVVLFHSDLGERMIENWNPFPSEIEAGPIEREFAANWRERVSNVSHSEGADTQVSSGHTCHYLYKNIVMDAAGRILPWCASPQ